MIVLGGIPNSNAAFGFKRKRSKSRKLVGGMEREKRGKRREREEEKRVSKRRRRGSAFI